MTKHPPRYGGMIFLWLTLILGLVKVSDLVDMSWWAVTFFLWSPGVALCAVVAGSMWLAVVFWFMRLGDEHEV